MKTVEKNSQMTSLSLLGLFSYIISKKLGSIALNEKNLKLGLSYKGGPNTHRATAGRFSTYYYLGNKYIAKIRISSFMVCKSTNYASQ